MICSGGDDTQGALHAKSPLEPHGAANKRILQFPLVFRRNSADSTSGQYAPALSNKVHPDRHVLTSLCSSSLMNIREHFHSFQRLFKQTWCLLIHCHF